MSSSREGEREGISIRQAVNKSDISYVGLGYGLKYSIRHIYGFLLKMPYITTYSQYLVVGMFNNVYFYYNDCHVSLVGKFARVGIAGLARR